jgi:head-tail adaptor
MASAGNYTERVTVRRPVAPTNDGGTPVPGSTSTLYARIPAEVLNATPGIMERVFAGQVQATASHVVKVRRRAVLLTDEIVWHYSIRGDASDRVLRITARAEDRESDETILAVVEQAS